MTFFFETHLQIPLDLNVKYFQICVYLIKFQEKLSEQFKTQNETTSEKRLILPILKKAGLIWCFHNTKQLVILVYCVLQMVIRTNVKQSNPGYCQAS